MSELNDLIVAMRKEGLFEGTPSLEDRAPLGEAMRNIPQDQVEEATQIILSMFRKRGYQEVLRVIRAQKRTGLYMFFLPMETVTNISVSTYEILRMMNEVTQNKTPSHVFSQGIYTPSGYHFYYNDFTLEDLLKEPLFLQNNFSPNTDCSSISRWYSPLPQPLYLHLKPLFDAKGWTLRRGDGGNG